MNIMKIKKKIKQTIIYIDNGRIATKRMTIDLEYMCDCSDNSMIDSVHSIVKSVLNFESAIFTQTQYPELLLNPLEDAGMCQLIIVNDIHDLVTPITDVIKNTVLNSNTPVKLIGLGIFIK